MPLNSRYSISENIIIKDRKFGAVYRYVRRFSSNATTDITLTKLTRRQPCLSKVTVNSVGAGGWGLGLYDSLFSDLVVSTVLYGDFARWPKLSCRYSDCSIDCTVYRRET
jgi:hypothetical protein